MAQNQSQFNQTLQNMSTLGKKSEEAINLMTGGDSYLYFECGALIGGPTEIEYGGVPKGVMVGNCFPRLVGKYPLAVHASMFGPPPNTHWETDYGTVRPSEMGQSRQSFYLMFYPVENKVIFNVFIVTSNGSYNQGILVKKFGEKWLWGSVLYKYEGTKGKLIKRFAAPGFPNEVLNGGWDKE